MNADSPHTLCSGADEQIFGWRWVAIQDAINRGSDPACARCLSLQAPQAANDRGALSPVSETNGVVVNNLVRSSLSPFAPPRSSVTVACRLEQSALHSQRGWQCLRMGFTNGKVCGHYGRSARHFDVSKPHLLHIPGHRDYLHCIAALPNQQQVATGSEDGTVGIWGERTRSMS